MRIPITLLINLSLFAACLSCDRTDDSLADYAQFGVFKDVYPLQDSVTVDLKAGDSVAVETNLGTLMIKNNYTFNECSEKNKDYCDIGATSLLVLSLQQKKICLQNSIESGVSYNPEQLIRLYPCNPVRIPDGPFMYSGSDLENDLFAGIDEDKVDVFYAGDYYSIGKMTIQFRRVYPLSKDFEDSKNLSKAKLYHVVFTMQRACR